MEIYINSLFRDMLRKGEQVITDRMKGKTL